MNEIDLTMGYPESSMEAIFKSPKSVDGYEFYLYFRFVGPARLYNLELALIESGDYGFDGKHDLYEDSC